MKEATVDATALMLDGCAWKHVEGGSGRIGRAYVWSLMAMGRTSTLGNLVKSEGVSEIAEAITELEEAADWWAPWSKLIHPPEFGRLSYSTLVAIRLDPLSSRMMTWELLLEAAARLRDLGIP